MFGLKVDLELVVKNLKQVKNQVSGAMKDIPGGIGQGALGGLAGGGAGGFGKMLGKLTLISGAAIVISEGVKKAVALLEKSSPYLKGVFDIFKRSVAMFFRPFGDFLASLLRPLALVLLKMAAKWLAFTRKEETRVAIAQQTTRALTEYGSRFRQQISDQIGEQILSDIEAGKMTFLALPEDLKENFIKWIAENKKSIENIPKEVRTNMVSWISTHAVELKNLAKEVNEVFSANLLSPYTEDQLKQPGENLANSLNGIFSATGTSIKSVMSNFISNLSSWLNEKIGGGGGDVGGDRVSYEEYLPEGPREIVATEDVGYGTRRSSGYTGTF